MRKSSIYYKFFYYHKIFILSQLNFILSIAAGIEIYSIYSSDLPIELKSSYMWWLS